MRITFLFLSLAVAFGISLPVSQLKANDVVGTDKVLEVVAEPTPVEGNQTEKVVEDEQASLVHQETTEVTDDNVQDVVNESETSDCEATTNDQATETVSVSEPVPTIMIEVFEAAEDTLPTAPADTLIDEVADIDGSVEETYVGELTPEVEASPVAESFEAVTEVAETATEETACLDIDATLADDSAIDQIVESADIMAVVEEIDEETVAEVTDDVCTEETSAPVCSENESIAGEATDELEETVVDEVICDAVEEAVSDEKPALAETNESDVVEEVVPCEADDMTYDEAFDAWTDAWVEYWAGESLDELGSISQAPCDNEADLEVSNDVPVEADPNEITDECYILEDCADEEAIEELDAETALEVADEVIETAEVQEPAAACMPVETLDVAEPATVRTIQLDGCTVTIQSNEQMDDFQLLNALWNAVNQLEIEMD
ncbi:MAG: hypothetical protein HYV60_01130 [Planctomycetia bacterium]|nr:hypothetical protein [Planctomycetia bacterium]